MTKLLGNIGRSLSTGTPALKQTEEITFVNPGSTQAAAKFLLLISDAVEESILQRYKINHEGALARIDNERVLYDGEHPYAVISLDGRENDELKIFAPTSASAAELDRFYNINDGTSQPLGTLVDALKLYSDIKFLDKAKVISEKLKQIPAGTPEHDAMLAQYNAYVSNIFTAELKPK